MSFDSEADNKAFAEKFNFNFPLLSDVDRKMGVAYGAADSEKEGFARRVGVVIGPDGKVKEWLPKVDAKSYPQDVLKRI